MPPTDLRIFGDPKAFRSRLLKRIAAGKELLAQIDAASATVREADPEEIARSLQAALESVMDEDRASRVRRSIITWHRSNRNLVERYLGPKASEVYGDRLSLSAGSTRADLLQDAQSVRDLIADLGAIEATLPAPRRVEDRPSVPHPLADLRSSGVFDKEIIDDFEARLKVGPDRRRWRRAIGASKELVEALHRGVFELLGQPQPPTSTDFAKLGKLAREALRDDLIAQSIGSVNVDQDIELERSLASLMHALAKLRNTEGDGHGRPRLNPDLSRRHVQLATDSALVYTRFVLDALNEAGRLPRSPS